MRIQALNLSNDDKECYIASINSKDIFKFSTISRMKDSKDGYQRHLSEKRAKDIAKYIDEGNIIPGCIILSAQVNANLSYDGSFLSFEESKDSFFVIDGQHRLYGSYYASIDLNLPVYIFNNLSIQEEVQYFLDVNSKQMGVPKTLRIELSKFLSEPGTKDEVRLNLFHRLNTDQTSPLFNRLTSTASISGKLSHVPFKDALDPILDSNVMNMFDLERKYLILKNFLLAVDYILTEHIGRPEMLTTTVFFNAIFMNFSLISEYSLIKGGYKIENFIETIKFIKDLDFTRFSGSGKSANKALADDIRDIIKVNHTTNNDIDNLF